MLVKLIGIDQVENFDCLPKRTFSRCEKAIEVLLEPANGDLWIAVLETGMLPIQHYSNFHSFSDGDTLFIVLGGKGHILEISTMRLKTSTTSDVIYSTFPWIEHNAILCEDSRRIFAYSQDGLEWRSERVALDGITWLDSTSQRVSARVHQDDGDYRMLIQSEPWKITLESPGAYPYELREV